MTFLEEITNGRLARLSVNTIEILQLPWEVYKVEPLYAIPGKEFLAYRPIGGVHAFSDHTKKFLGHVNAPTEKAAIAQFETRITGGAIQKEDGSWEMFFPKQ
jgi:hypothetical protein